MMHIPGSGKDRKAVSINPHKLGQPLGAVLALQGIYRAIPLLHGGQGCAAFAKALAIRHFREPIAVQNSALHEYNVIFGGEHALTEALDTIVAKQRPSLIAVISTSLTEVAGEDLEGALTKYTRDRSSVRYGGYGEQGPLICPVHAPDYEGSLESGYARMVESVLRTVLFEGTEGRRKAGGDGTVRSGKKVKNRVVLLPGSHLTPGDVMEVKDILASFGLEVIAIPDLSTSLSGHLLTGHTPLTRGGSPLDLLEEISTAEWTIAIGRSMEGAARILEEQAGIPYQLFGSLLGLQASDAFFSFLQSRTKRAVPLTYRWQREFLLDGMLDAHFVFGGMKLWAALEPDHLIAVREWLSELGVNDGLLVSPVLAISLKALEGVVQVGDLSDLEQACRNHGAEGLWISNSHGEQAAVRLGIPFIPCGFPIFDRLGSAHAVAVGYRGTLEMVHRVGNVLLEFERRRGA